MDDGALPVPGAIADAERTAAMIRRLVDKIDDIHLTVDSHHKMDISHPMWWVDEHGNRPEPLTGVVVEADAMWFFDYVKRSRTVRAHTRILSMEKRTLAYLQALTAKQRYPHTIWPEHCLIGDPGHNLHPAVAEAVHHWEEKRIAMSDVVTKGSNPWTEHFSAVMAEVPDPEDPSTQLNRAFVDTVESADMVLWTGQALNFCLANTFRDTVNHFNDPSVVTKMVLLTDATSPVPGFDALTDSFMREMTQRGMRTSTTVDILK